MDASDRSVWRCPVCETLNTGDVCIICGEKKTLAADTPTRPGTARETVPGDTKKLEPAGKLIPDKPDPKVREKPESRAGSGTGHKPKTAYETAPRKKSKSSAGKKLVLAIVLISSFIILTIACSMGFIYKKGEQAMSEGDYALAKRLISVVNIGNAEEMLKECDYQLASESFSGGRLQEAKAAYKSLGDYKDSAEMALKCDYYTAQYYEQQNQLLSAYDTYEALGAYADSQQKLIGLKAKIYEEGKKFYENKSYDTAKAYFEKSVDIGYESAYLTLIQAAQNPASVSVETLYDIIYLDETKEMLESDAYLEDFLLGTWNSVSGYQLKIYSSGDSLVCSYDMPVNAYGESWKVQDSAQYFGSDQDGWTKYWSFNIISEDEIDITIERTGLTYLFNRN